MSYISLEEIAPESVEIEVDPVEYESLDHKLEDQKKAESLDESKEEKDNEDDDDLNDLLDSAPCPSQCYHHPTRLMLT